MRSDSTQIADEAVTGAVPHVYLAHPETFVALAEDIAGCWEKLRLTRHGHSGRDLEALVRRTMAEHQVLPTQVHERITANPIHS